MKDVAEAAEVSVMAVSYALRGSKQVSEKTRRRVEKVAKRLGYQRDPLMTRLSSYRNRKARSDRGTCLAWLNLHLSPESWKFEGSHHQEAFEGAERRAGNLGYRLEMFDLHLLGGWKRTIEILRARGIEGVIIGQPPPGVDKVELDRSHFATVTIGRAIRFPELPRVLLNHVECVTQVMQQMLELGYRRIGLVMELQDCIKNSYRNVGGYHSTCEKLHIPAADRVPPLIPERLEAGNLATWIKRWKVEGILVHRPDQMPQFLPELDLKVPEDIGYAHISMHEPSETTSGLYFDPAHLGSWAVDLVHWLLDREEKGIPDPTPALMLTTCQWNQGKTLRGRF
jgi:LacI family transcriptional regulator